MNTKHSTDRQQNSGASFDHAVVIGGSIAGMAVAKVLADHASQVTIIERDQLPDTPEFRRGAPQARHSHILLPSGQMILERRFPGATDELLARGSTWVEPDTELVKTADGAWLNDLPGLICSRPLLENVIYRQLGVQPRVRFLQDYQVTKLSVDSRGRRVTGVCLSRGRGVGGREICMNADLVVDTTGRGSRAPHWLAGLGYTPPSQTIVNSYAGYTSRIYRRPADVAGEWKMMRIRDEVPHNPRRGMIFPLEGLRQNIDELWQTVTGSDLGWPATEVSEGMPSVPPARQPRPRQETLSLGVWVDQTVLH